MTAANRRPFRVVLLGCCLGVLLAVAMMGGVGGDPAGQTTNTASDAQPDGTAESHWVAVQSPIEPGFDVASANGSDVASANGTDVAYLRGTGEANSLFFIGSEVIVVGEPIDAAHTNGEPVELRSIDDTNSGEITESSSEETLTTETDFTTVPFDPADAKTPTGSDPEAFVRIETAELSDGDYFLRDFDDRIAETEDNGIELVRQQLSGEWEEEIVDISADEATLELDSQRSTYNVNVSAPGLSYEELESLFIGNANTTQQRANAPLLDRPPFTGSDEDSGNDLSARTEKAATHADEDVIVLQGGPEERIRATPDDSGVDEGSYSFNLSVTDATATADAGVTLSDIDAEATFEQDRYETAAGDVFTVTVDLSGTDDAYLVFGDGLVGYLDVIYLEDGTDDGTVEFTVNTRLIGTQPQSDNESAGGDDAFTSEDDTVKSLAATNNDEPPGSVSEAFAGLRLESEPGALVTLSEGADAADGSLNALRSELGMSPLIRPLQPETYPMTLNTEGVISTDGDGTLRAQGSDFTVVDFTPPGPESAAVGTIPVEESGVDSASSLRDRFDEVETATEDDRLVVRFNATGHLGEFAASSPGEPPREAVSGEVSAERLADLSAAPNGMTFELAVDPGSPNRQSVDIDLDDTAVAAYLDRNATALYVIVDPDHDAIADASSGETIAATMEYETSDERYRFATGAEGSAFDAAGPFDGGADGDPSTPAQPYLPADETVTRMANVTVADPEVTFNHGTADNVYLTDGGSPTLAGSTTVAPGSTLRFLVSGTVEDPFSGVAETSVTPNQTFVTTVETDGGRTGQPVTVAVRNGAGLDERDGRLVPTLAALEVDDPEPAERQRERIVVDAVSLPEGGFVAVLDDDARNSLRGASEPLPAGTHDDIDVDLERPLRKNATVRVVAYQNTTASSSLERSAAGGVAERPYEIGGTTVAEPVSIGIVNTTIVPQPRPPREPQAARGTTNPSGVGSATEARTDPTVSAASDPDDCETAVCFGR